jgi:molecular chaperone DnaK (HSP70)
MKLDIDSGTTRTVVAHAGQGSFPITSFDAPECQVHDWFPPVAAINGPSRRYGWDAIAAQDDEGWAVLRSLKRYFRPANPRIEVHIAGQALPLRQLMAEMMGALCKQLLERSNLCAAGDAEDAEDSHVGLEIMLGVPANASSNQRFLNEEAAQEAGFLSLPSSMRAGSPGEGLPTGTGFSFHSILCCAIIRI